MGPGASERPAELGLTVEEGLAALTTSGMGDLAFSLCLACSAAFWTWTFSLNHLEDEGSWKTVLKTPRQQNTFLFTSPGG